MNETLRRSSRMPAGAARLWPHRLDHATSLELLDEMLLEPVPQLGTMVLDNSVDDLVAIFEGTSVLNPKVQREGIVIHPLSEECDEEIGGRLSFKAINPKFLLKYDE